MSIFVSTLQSSRPSIPSTVCSKGTTVFLELIVLVVDSIKIKLSSTSPSNLILPFILFCFSIVGFTSTSIILLCSTLCNSGTLTFSLMLHVLFLHCLLDIVLTIVWSKSIFSPGQYIS